MPDSIVEAAIKVALERADERGKPCKTHTVFMYNIYICRIFTGRGVEPDVAEGPHGEQPQWHLTWDGVRALIPPQYSDSAVHDRYVPTPLPVKRHTLRSLSRFYLTGRGDYKWTVS